jgi:ribosome-associated protein
VDYFVVCTGASERQLKAIADGIEEHALKTGDAKPRRREGTAESGWILLDYSSAVVHIFSASQRKFWTPPPMKATFNSSFRRSIC